MSFEEIKNTEGSLEIIPLKEKLKEMEATGKYLFHGSPYKLDRFEPQQALTARDGESIPDEDPAIFASSEIEIPIFRSIFHPSHYENLEGQFSTGMSHGDGMDPVFEVSKNAMEASRDKEGYVYVFNKEDFELRNNVEYRSKKSVKPLAVFHTSFKDIGLPIKVSEHNS